jgi:hypothetical protein
LGAVSEEFVMQRILAQRNTIACGGANVEGTKRNAATVSDIRCGRRE